MKYIAWDTETFLIAAGEFAPRMVCLTWADGKCSGIYDREDGTHIASLWLYDHNTTLIGHNVWFDLAVLVAARPELMPVVFDKIDRGLIADTMLRQQMIDVAEGKLKYHIDEETGEVRPSTYSLAALCWRLLNVRLPKEDTWRLRYSELDNVPLSEWPADATEYAIRDAEMTMAVFQHQAEHIERVPWGITRIDGWHIRREIPNQLEQHRAAWALHLMSREGVRTDPQAVSELKAKLTEEYDRQMTALRPTGLLNITPPRVLKSGPRKGQTLPEHVSKDMKMIYARAQAAYAGRQLPATETGRPATDKKTLKASGDPDLALLADAGHTQKLLTTYVPILESGTVVPIHARYNAIRETGRASCSGPNMQNPPRAGGVRECFVPRPGHVFGFVDYDTLELRALAQTCLDVLGYSNLAEAVRRGEDLHLSLAAEMLGISVGDAGRRKEAGDPQIKEYRQQAKPANFGFPGGMQPEAFREYAQGYGINLTQKQARDLHEAWFRKWSEMRFYFNHVQALPDPLTQNRSGRIRGGASFCAAANGFFQGLAADGAKEALWRVAKECYLPGTELYGSKPVLFLHDEIGIETPDGPGAAPACERLAVVMREAMEKWIPDVPIRCGPVMMRRWYKGAEAVRVNGVLVPSKPEGNKWIADLPKTGLSHAA